MKYIGIDIGSTCAKTAVLDENGTLAETFVIPTGWSSFEALDQIKKKLSQSGIKKEEMTCVSTGYGRAAVDFADKKITEITCHARGAVCLFGEESLDVIDIGGQDTKVISINGGRVGEFFMNDKCSAGTGKFIEIMANRLCVSLKELDQIASMCTENLSISSMCTVFAESEIVALIGRGTSKENIAWGVLNSVTRKVKQEYARLHASDHKVCLTGGLCESSYFIEMLGQELGVTVVSDPMARYAGAIGAAHYARDMS